MSDDGARFLDGLDAAQLRAVSSPDQPLCILAGAGSGKTRVLTRRVGYRIAIGAAEPGHVLVLTFTRRAAAELVERLRAMGLRERMAAGTFHAIAYAALRQRWAEQRRTPPDLLDRKVRIIGPMLGRRQGRQAFVTPADVAGEIEWAKARLVGPDAYEDAAAAAGRRPPLPPAEIARMYQRYEDTKRKQRLVDFDDLLLLCAQAVERDPEFGEQQRWRYRHLFVDEFQDVNPLQFRLLEAWRGGRADLCVVGDPNQAIYGWNGADPDFIRRFADHVPGATVVRLTENYRSTPQVLSAAFRILTTQPGAGEPLNAHRPDGPEAQVHEFADDTSEAVGIARLLGRLRPHNGTWSHCAVLTRTNAQLVLIERALAAARIPCRVRGGQALVDRPEVRAFFSEAAGTAGLEVALADLDALVAADETLAIDRRATLEQLVTLGREYLLVDPKPNLAGFRTWLTTIEGGTDQRGEPAVDLATFHAAKGLEWPAVVLAGMERGLVPIGQANAAAELAEETRLAYVAITRARHELHCTWARRRTFGQRSVERQPSSFLPLVLPPVPPERDVLASKARVRSNLDLARQAHQASARPARRRTDDAEVDEVLLARLKAWRTAEAKAARVPAYVVFSDATLTELAARRPRSPVQLLTVPGIGPVKAGRYGDALLALLIDEQR